GMGRPPGVRGGSAAGSIVASAPAVARGFRRGDPGLPSTEWLSPRHPVLGTRYASPPSRSAASRSALPAPLRRQWPGRDPARSFAVGLDPALILRAQGLDADPWQRDFLRCADRRVLLNCCRQSGKSTAVAARALHTALFAPRSLVLLLSPTQRQSD